MSEDIEHFEAAHIEFNGSRSNGGFHHRPPTAIDTADYVRDMLLELETMAARAGLATLAAMINFAAEEAKQNSEPRLS